MEGLFFLNRVRACNDVRFEKLFDSQSAIKFNKDIYMEIFEDRFPFKTR